MHVRQQHLQVLKNLFHLHKLRPTLSRRERRASVAIILRVRPDGMPQNICPNENNESGVSAFQGNGPHLCSSFLRKDKVFPDFASITGFESTGPAGVDIGVGGFQKDKLDPHGSDPQSRSMVEVLHMHNEPVQHLDVAKWLAQDWVQKGQLECMYIRRAPNPGDLWSGQIGFPGGRKQDKESDLECVMREVFEEVNQSLGDSSQYVHLGQLSDFNIAPSHASMKVFTVCTFVFLQVTPLTPPCKLEPKEISKVIYTPVDFFGISTSDRPEVDQPLKAFLAPSMHKVKRLWRASQVTKDMHRSWHPNNDTVEAAAALTSSTQLLEEQDSAVLHMTAPIIPLQCSIQAPHEHKQFTPPAPQSYTETVSVEEVPGKRAMLVGSLEPVFEGPGVFLKKETVLLTYPPAARTTLGTHLSARSRDRPALQNSFTTGSYYNGPVTPWRYFDYLSYTRAKSSEASKAPVKGERKPVSVPLVWYPFSIKVPCMLQPGTGVVHRKYVSDPSQLAQLPASQENLPFVSTEDGDPDCQLWGMTLRNTCSFAAALGFPAAKEFVFGEMTRYRGELEYYFAYSEQYQRLKTLGTWVSSLFTSAPSITPSTEPLPSTTKPIIEEPESHTPQQLTSKL